MSNSSSRRGSVVDENPKCGECHKEIRVDNNDSHLFCKLCQRDFHLMCSGLSQPAYKELMKPNAKLRYYCDVCAPIADKLVDTLVEVNRKYDKLEARFSTLEKRLEDLVPAQVNAVPPVSVSHEVPQGLSVVEATLNELHDQQRRERNLMVFGLPEAADGNADTDRAALEELLSAVGLTNDSLVEFKRFGRAAPDKTRAVKMVMGSRDVKYEALSKAKSLLNNPKFKAVYIKPDLTELQLKKQRALVSALKDANKNGKKTVAIRRVRLVPLAQTGGGGQPQ